MALQEATIAIAADAHAFHSLDDGTICLNFFLIGSFELENAISLSISLFLSFTLPDELVVWKEAGTCKQLQKTKKILKQGKDS
jgi:hypothetical protein